MENDFWQSLVGVLNQAVFLPREDGSYLMVGAKPPWLASLWPQVLMDKGFLVAAEFSPFLDNFLVDAVAYWKIGQGPGPASGTWIERNDLGQEVALEARALNFNGQPVLLIEELGQRHRDRAATLQLAREAALAHERLNQEVQKKQILVHCVVNDLASQLGNLITSLRLIELENPSAKVRKLTNLASRAAQQQHELINHIFETFLREPDAFHGGQPPGNVGVDMGALINRVTSNFEPEAKLRGVRIELSGTSGSGVQPIRVTGDSTNLERLLSNLVRDALSHSMTGQTVQVSLAVEVGTALVSVEDECVAMPISARAAGLNAFSHPGETVDPGALTLHFCRIVVENWGGELGCEPRTSAGNRFWFRLPLADS